VGLGSSVKDWFTDTLGIQSPSRVFIGYGANLSEGAAIGIRSQTVGVRQAALDMAAQSHVDMSPPNPLDVSRASLMGSASAESSGAQGSVNFHFSPHINVPNGANVNSINQGLQACYNEWMRMMERYQHDKRRRSYGPADEVTV
jgi:hypothetical protein